LPLVDRLTIHDILGTLLDDCMDELLISQPIACS